MPILWLRWRDPSSKPGTAGRPFRERMTMSALNATENAAQESVHPEPATSETGEPDAAEAARKAKRVAAYIAAWRKSRLRPRKTFAELPPEVQAARRRCTTDRIGFVPIDEETGMPLDYWPGGPRPPRGWARQAAAQRDGHPVRCPPPRRHGYRPGGPQTRRSALAAAARLRFSMGGALVR
jgi:hypothetical protein